MAFEPLSELASRAEAGCALAFCPMGNGSRAMTVPPRIGTMSVVVGL
jgi:hypothetical protein